MKEIMDFSSLLTKLQAWDSVLLRFLATWVIPYQPDRRVADQLGDLIRKAPKLDFADVGPGFARGKLAWADEEKIQIQRVVKGVVGGTEVKNRAIGLRRGLLPFMGALVGLLSFIWLVAIR